MGDVHDVRVMRALWRRDVRGVKADSGMCRLKCQSKGSEPAGFKVIEGEGIVMKDG